MKQYHRKHCSHKTSHRLGLHGSTKLGIVKPVMEMQIGAAKSASEKTVLVSCIIDVTSSLLRL